MRCRSSNLYDVDSAAEHILKIEDKLAQIKRGPFRLHVNQEINITVWMRLASCYGAKHPHVPSATEGRNVQNLLSMGPYGVHRECVAFIWHDSIQSSVDALDDADLRPDARVYLVAMCLVIGECLIDVGGCQTRICSQHRINVRLGGPRHDDRPDRNPSPAHDRLAAVNPRIPDDAGVGRAFCQCHSVLSTTSIEQTRWTRADARKEAPRVQGL